MVGQLFAAFNRRKSFGKKKKKDENTKEQRKTIKNLVSIESRCARIDMFRLIDSEDWKKTREK